MASGLDWEGLYEVSDLGRVRSLSRKTSGGYFTRPKILRPGLNSSGYPSVCLSRNGVTTCVSVHLLVAAAFIGRRPAGLQTCHNDGIPTNNAPTNLRYDTPAANQVDRRAHGTSNAGEKHARAKLTEAQVLAMRQRLSCGRESLATVAAAFGVSASAVRDIKNGKRWKYLTKTATEPPQS